MVNFNIKRKQAVVKDLRQIDGSEQKKIFSAIVKYLENIPDEPHGTRIKKMEHLEQPQYRLRVGDYRVFYDVENQDVIVLGIVHKKKTEKWLRSNGV